MSALAWVLVGLAAYAVVVTLVLALVRGGRLAEDAERAARERFRWELDRVQR